MHAPALSRLLIASAAVLAIAGGCAVGPSYKQPQATTTPAAFKETSGWLTSAPGDAVTRGTWWEAFHDPTLNALEVQVASSNQTLIEDATFDYTMGDSDGALAKLHRAAAAAPGSFEAWQALAEINFSLRRFDDALAAAERAHALRADDLFINTTLSRIWMEKGDKATAEKYGAQAKILSWKDQLKNPDAVKEGL